ncbi:hypothetical protein ES332_D02G011800v1 [Gossypium tomentosum]|uniref:Uncharacterized protein n=1 Tax=Gossypium tomentosum TaxID=34277 RepID=A0A5D2LSF4_GOSTO|nr:hypothetical protein ES332_D02G011800v1 [Gossypium tomentosum]
MMHQRDDEFLGCSQLEHPRSPPQLIPSNP